MEKFTASLYEKMCLSLAEINKEGPNMLQQAHKAIEIIQRTLIKLREFIVGYTFADIQEEIQFFKTEEPKLHSELIYYVKLYQLERRKPEGGKQILERFFQKELKQIYFFFLENEDFYKYHRSGSSFLDEMYFTRNSISSELSVEEYTSILDTQFCTAQGFKIAKIHAYQRLQDYLEESLCQLEQSDGKTQGKNKKKHSLQWTASKTDLIELLYGLQSVGVFNNSQADVKKIAGFLEDIFQVSLGNYYRVFQEIRIRKKSRTGFLDKMRETLVRRMDETDMRE